MRNYTDQKDKEILELKDKIRFWMSKFDDLERQMVKAGPEVEQLQAKLHEVKQQLANSTYSESELRDRLS